MKIYKSPRADLIVPNLDILTLLFEDTLIHVEAANPANSISKAEARLLTQRLAHVFREKFGIGIHGPGKDAVLTVLDGSAFAPVLFYGLIAAGGIFCGASTEAQVGELLRQIEDSGASLLVCSSGNEATAVKAAQERKIPLDRVLLLDGSKPHSWTLTCYEGGHDFLAGQTGPSMDWLRLTDPAQLGDTTICLLYSSGTTGLPKGVRISHRSLVANNVCTMDVARRYQCRQAQKGKTFRFNTIAHLPISNIAGVSLYSTNPFYMGGTTYWMKKFDFDLFLHYHRVFRPAYQFSVPPIWMRIAKSDLVRDHFDELQVAVTGSAPIGHQILEELRTKLGKGKVELAQTWGTTETAGVITAQDWPAYGDDGTWSVGELCPNVTLRVVDDQNVDVSPGESGELLVKGPILAQSYHNRPEVNAQSYLDGYYKTGDIGTVRNGRVYIHDRKKELIKYKGAQIAPAELEALLCSHKSIADAAVIGVWHDEQQTEIPRAYVVRRQTLDGAPIDPISEHEVLDFVKSNVSSYKQLRGGVIFCNEIPKSPSGKILRKELRQDASSKARAKL